MTRNLQYVAALAVLCLAGGASAQEQKAPAHVLLTPAETKWSTEVPPVFEKGMLFTVVSGDPGKPGAYVVRVKMPAGYKIAAHWHPTDENVTVLTGTFALGMGDKFDKAALKEVPAGGFALLPAEMRHFAMAKTAVTIQVHGQGPFTLTYVNPDDDPSKRAPMPAKPKTN
jgi:quercetin dioxygenase-like cupin family protein